MANAIERQPSGLFLLPESFRESEIGVAHHAEDLTNPPFCKCFRHYIGHGSNCRFILLDADVHAIVAHFHGVRRDAVVVASGRFSGHRIEVPAVPGAAQPTVLYGALSEWSPLMRAFVVERCVASLDPTHANRVEPAGHGFDPAFGKLLEV